MRRGLLACLLAGCYHASNLACAVSCDSDQSCPGGLQCGLSDHLCHAGGLECSEIDAGVPDDAGGRPISDAVSSDATSAPFCPRSEASIVACYEFENTTDDESQYMLPTKPTVGITFPPSMTGLGQALQLASDSNVQIAETVVLDRQTFTVEAWLYPSSTNGQNVSVVNNGGQYGMFVDTTDAPYCAKVTPAKPPDPPVLVTALGSKALAPNQWTHVACVYDGTALTLYVNGTKDVANTFGGGAVVTTGTTGTGIGSETPTTAEVNHYVGLIDNLRIWSVARIRADLCADAAPNCP
ncbi:MAG TPA: LamG domain-containing protein [Kofleriaceae bacterium]|jgi:hypothetical protein|nr:LamG domain-containing protein [Kofleriaceae bacterium]